MKFSQSILWCVFNFPHKLWTFLFPKACVFFITSQVKYMRGDTSIDSQAFKNSRNWSVWNCFRFLSQWKCLSKWDGKIREALKKKIPSDRQKFCLCSQCHERLNKLMALDASIFLIGKEGNYFYSHFKAEVSPQTWHLALQVSKSKVPVTRMCSLLVRGGGGCCITSVASLNPSIPNCSNA